MIIGREKEVKLLNSISQGDSSHFLAVYGRRYVLLTKSSFRTNISLVYNNKKGYEKEEYTSLAYQRESFVGWKTIQR